MPRARLLHSRRTSEQRARGREKEPLLSSARRYNIYNDRSRQAGRAGGRSLFLITRSFSTRARLDENYSPRAKGVMQDERCSFLPSTNDVSRVTLAAFLRPAGRFSPIFSNFSRSSLPPFLDLALEEQRTMRISQVLNYFWLTGPAS